MKKQVQSILQELQSKVPGDLSLLVSSLSLMIEMMISLGDKQNEQVKSQSKQIKSQSKQIESQSKQIESQSKQIESQSKQIESQTKQIESQTKQIENQTKLIETQNTNISSLTDTVKKLEEEIKELRRQLKLNSSNSSKPPSTDGFKKPNRNNSLRTKSGKKPGGQVGHKGANLSIPHEPDEVKQYIPNKCKGCPNLENCIASSNIFECTESRYVVDVKVITTVTEHQTLKVVECPHNEVVTPSSFPPNIKAHVQYGESITVLSGLLSTYGAVSLKRIHVLLGSLLGVKISPATIYSMVSKCAKMVEPIMEKVKTLITQADVGHFDETGIRALGKLFWVHNSSTDMYTYQTVNQKRGSEGMEDNGVLSLFKGVAVHDCWNSYWFFEDVLHAVCGAHLLRELNGVIDNNPEHTWAVKCKDLLLNMLNTKKNSIDLGLEKLDEDKIKQYYKEYDDIFKIADKECPPPPEPTEKKRGRKAKGKERALIERLVTLKDSVCLFIKNFAVPFDNNQAERDVRNVKTKAKVSGGYRSLEGVKDYLTIMSYLSTANKHGINAFKALTSAFAGEGEAILGLGGSE